MAVLTSSQATLIAFIVAPGLFLVSAWLTHASRRHLLGALIGSGLYAGLNFLWDRMAATFGWWNYPGWSASGQLPWIIYLLAGLVGGGAGGLVGWRIVRRWKWKGLAGFLIFWVFYALVHDIGGSLLFASSNLMHFGTGPVPILMDGLWYISGNALPLAAIWYIGERLV